MERSNARDLNVQSPLKGRPWRQEWSLPPWSVGGTSPARRTGDYCQWTGLLTWPDSYPLGRVRTQPATCHWSRLAVDLPFVRSLILSLSPFVSQDPPRATNNGLSMMHRCTASAVAVQARQASMREASFELPYEMIGKWPVATARLLLCNRTMKREGYYYLLDSLARHVLSHVWFVSRGSSSSLQETSLSSRATRPTRSVGAPCVLRSNAP